MVRTNHALAALAAALTLAATAATAAEGDGVSLFRIVTVRDEIVIGVTRDELAMIGNRPALDQIAEHLARQGRLLVWRYSSGKGPDGSLRQMPQHRVAIFAGPVLRIEPVRTDLPIDLPKP